VLVAGQGVLAKARSLAAHLLEAAVEDLEIRSGVGLAVRGTPTSTLTWGQLSVAADDPTKLPPGMDPGLRAAPGFQMAPGGTAPFGCHVAVVEVDSETGAVSLLRLVAVDDCGRILNPTLATGQVHGGLTAGIGQALFEEIRYDRDGNPVNASFAEYLFPSAADLPSYETHHTVTPTTKNPLGAKGIGEAGTTGSLAAVHNAVVDAVSHLGVRHLDLPLTPERVWRAISEARSPRYGHA
jgi:carbon-monoxide dehydrogenase large subunit